MKTARLHLKNGILSNPISVQKLQKLSTPNCYCIYIFLSVVAFLSYTY